jgi:branched-chain amino acid transport system substrate-binding protein
LVASIDAFNKRGGAGTTHARLEADVCDSKGDANGEVACARQLVSDGVVATFNDLTFNNPSGVVDIFQAAGIPRIGIGGTDISEFMSSVSYPISAGVIATYLGVAVGFKQDHDTKVCLVRTDAPTGATFKGFIEPSFNAIGDKIICDVAVATGATDYAPYVAQVQRQKPTSLLISHTDAVTTQLIAAMAQLNAKIPLGGNPGSFTPATLRKYKSITKGTVMSDSFPYPSPVNEKNFPGLKKYFADMTASHKSTLSAANIKPQYFASWISTLAFVNVTKTLASFTPATVVQALQSAKDVDLLGLTPAWTPSTPGFSVFKSSSNHFVYVSRFNGKDVVTNKKPIDVTQYIK